MSKMQSRTVYKAFDAEAPKQVDAIRIEWMQDESPDTSYLGKYSNNAGPNAIDRKARGDMRRNEYQFFNPGQNYADCTPEDRASYFEQDYQRSERLNAGDWCYLGVRAVAEVSYPISNGNRRTETLTSGGLWGIESDSDAKYALEVEAQELADLKEHLKQFGLEWPL